MELFKEDGTWRVSFMGMNGKTITRSTKCANREDAEQVVKDAKIRELEMAAKAKALNGESLTAIMAGRKVSAEAACTEWEDWKSKNSAANTVRTQSIVTRQFLREAGCASWSVARITDDMIDKFVNKGGRSTRDMRLASLRSFFSFCSIRAYTVGNPSMLVKVRVKGMTHAERESKPRQPITEAELAKLVANTDGFWRHAILLSYWTGMRLSDICCLEWDSIKATSIVIWTQKTETRVEVPLAEPLIGSGQLAMTILEMMESARPGRYIFPEERRIILDPEKRAKLSVYAGRIFTRAGVNGKSFHCLRHSFVTRLQKAGKSLEEIGKIVGHTNTETTKGYAHN